MHARAETRARVLCLGAHSDGSIYMAATPSTWYGWVLTVWEAVGNEETRDSRWFGVSGCVMREKCIYDFWWVFYNFKGWLLFLFYSFV